MYTTFQRTFGTTVSHPHVARNHTAPQARFPSEPGATCHKWSAVASANSISATGPIDRPVGGFLAQDDWKLTSSVSGPRGWDLTLLTLPYLSASTAREAKKKSTMATTRSAKDVIAALSLVPHPEKGYFVETFRDAHLSSDKRSYGTCIYYLLEGETGLSHWHRVLDATEVWHYYAGAPLRLSLSWDDGKPVRDVVLGNDLWDVREYS